MSNPLCRHLIIHGSVQGVGFRNTMRHRARKLGVSGWVKNRTDGTVEAVIFGTEAQIQSMISWVRQGPPLARVTRVEIIACTDPHCTPPADHQFIRLSTE